MNNSKEETKSKAKTPRIEGVELSKEQEKFLLPHFLLLVIGKPGSGKSYLVKELTTSKAYYHNKFEYTLVISPSVQKLGITTKKEFKHTVYDLDWLYAQFTKINQAQIKKMQNMIKLTQKKDQIPFIPQSIIYRNFMSKNANSLPTTGPALPPDYVAFNKNYRFFTLEMLAIMNQGFSNVMKSGFHPPLPGPPLKFNKRDLKSKTKDEQVKYYLYKAAAYGGFKDVDDIEYQLVAKLDATQQAETRTNVLLVLDDVVGEIKANENNFVQSQLFFNRRHLIANGTVSIIVVSQKYTMIPARIRSTASWLILFRLNPVDADNVYKDVVMTTPQRWYSVLDRVYGTDYDGTLLTMKSKRYDHLDIWVEYDMFFKNFQQVMLCDESPIEYPLAPKTQVKKSCKGK